MNILILYNDKTTLDAIYPKGSIYITTNTSVPSGFPGTWTEITAGYFLKTVGSNATAGNTASAGNTGSTTLTAAQSGVPAHSHGFTNPTYTTGTSGAHQHLGYVSASTYAAGSAQNAVSLSNGTLIGNQYVTNSTGDHTHTISVSSNGSVNNSTAKSATSGHTHTAGDPASYGVHVFKRTA